VFALELRGKPLRHPARGVPRDLEIHGQVLEGNRSDGIRICSSHPLVDELPVVVKAHPIADPRGPFTVMIGVFRNSVRYNIEDLVQGLQKEQFLILRCAPAGSTRERPF
jgi:hypothetical protein